MALEGLFRFPRLPAAPTGSENAEFYGNRWERLVTTVAVSTAVLVVALIAILLGMASP